MSLVLVVEMMAHFTTAMSSSSCFLWEWKMRVSLENMMMVYKKWNKINKTIDICIQKGTGN